MICKQDTIDISQLHSGATTQSLSQCSEKAFSCYTAIMVNGVGVPPNRDEVSVDEALQHNVGEFGWGQRWNFCLVHFLAWLLRQGVRSPGILPSPIALVAAGQHSLGDQRSAGDPEAQKHLHACARQRSSPLCAAADCHTCSVRAHSGTVPETWACHSARVPGASN